MNVETSIYRMTSVQLLARRDRAERAGDLRLAGRITLELEERIMDFEYEEGKR